jgi:radical SAM superfamily enzyme YgiQ (UPF0313 family)
MKRKINIALISIYDIDYGLRHISSVLLAHGYNSYLIQFQTQKRPREHVNNDFLTAPPLRQKPYTEKNLSLLLKLINKIKPQLIGISVTSTNFITAKEITSRIKKIINIPIVWGGIHAIICPEDCIRYADIICTGEGEYSMLEIAEAITNQTSLNQIQGLWIKQPDGNIIKTPMRQLIENLDILPFPDMVKEGNKFLIDDGEIIPDPVFINAYEKYQYMIMSSRGCMYKCAYCCNSIIKEHYKGLCPYLRRRSPEHVIDELEYAIKNSFFHRVRFFDDIFTYDSNWIERFCSLYSKKISLPFMCYVHPVYSEPKILKELAKVGLATIIVGIQSGSKEITENFFQRQQQNEQLIKLAYLTKKLGLYVFYDLLVDNPYETNETANETAELILKLPHPKGTVIFSLCHFPKTPLTERTLKDNLIKPKEIEGENCNKALNNFFMFLDYSRNKFHYFWNCIFAMSMIRFFSPRIIKFCKDSKFFQNYPKILYILTKLYLIPFKYLLYNRKLDYAISHYRLDYHCVISNIKNKLNQPKIKFLVYKIGENKIKIEIDSKFPPLLQFIKNIQILIRPYKENYYPKNNKIYAKWSINLPKIKKKKTLEIDFLMPEINVKINGKSFLLYPDYFLKNKELKNLHVMFRLNILRIIKKYKIIKIRKKFFLAKSLYLPVINQRKNESKEHYSLITSINKC